MNNQSWFPLGWTGLISLQSKGLSRIFSQHHSSKASILQCSAFFLVQLSHPYVTTGKTIALTRQTFVGKVMSLLFNIHKYSLDIHKIPQIYTIYLMSLKLEDIYLLKQKVCCKWIHMLTKYRFSSHLHFHSRMFSSYPFFSSQLQWYLFNAVPPSSLWKRAFPLHLNSQDSLSFLPVTYSQFYPYLIKHTYTHTHTHTYTQIHISSL